MTRSAIVCGALLAALVSMPALAQQGGGGLAGSPRYDPKTEVVVNCTVEEVKEYPHDGGGQAGQHVTLKSDKGSLSVHLGPSDFWKKNGFVLVKGDSIEVTGSKSTVDGAEVVDAGTANNPGACRRCADCAQPQRGSG